MVSLSGAVDGDVMWACDLIGELRMAESGELSGAAKG